jgi:hypothetical protein
MGLDKKRCLGQCDCVKVPVHSSNGMWYVVRVKIFTNFRHVDDPFFLFVAAGHMTHRDEGIAHSNISFIPSILKQ